MRGIPWPVAVVLIAACAGSPVAATPSPGSLAASTTVGSHGSLFFVSDSVGWEVTEPPDALRTVILRTEDGGGHWRIWGIAPEAGSPAGFTTTDAVLTYQNQLLRSSDGSRWTIKTMPGDAATVTFLPDLVHGWLYGFQPFTSPSPVPIVSGKGGTGSSGGKGGTGSSGGKGGSAGTGACQDKGCVPTALWSTGDGGASWRMVWQGTFSQGMGSIYFWSPTSGMIANGLSLQLTHDDGRTWRAVHLNIAGVGSDQPVNDLAPTMFDTNHGALPIQAPNGIYLSRTDDAGVNWSAPVPIEGCAPCGSNGQLVLLDDQRWVAYSTSVSGLSQGSAVYLTSDGGATWKRAATTNPGKTASDVELVRSPAATVIVVAPGIFASATSDWGAHWRAVGLPDVYPSYKGFDGAGGWSG